MIYQNSEFNGTLRDWSKRLKASLPAAHPERWPVPDGEDAPVAAIPSVPEPLPPTADELLQYLESARKSVEEQGVTVGGIRYSGSPAGRQTLSEAIRYADSEEVELFTSWKDSDNQYHANHPVADVKLALAAILTQRGALIAKEAIYAQQIIAEQVTTFAEIDAIEWIVIA